MGISDKMRAVLAMCGKSTGDLADYLGVSSQAIHNKLNRESFSADDLIKISAFVGAELMLRMADGSTIMLDENDLQKSKKEGLGRSEPES